MEQNLNLEPLQSVTHSQMVEEGTIELQPAQGFEIKLEDQAVHIEEVFQDGLKDPNQAVHIEQVFEDGPKDPNQPVHIEQVFHEGQREPKLEPEDGEVQVIYLNVPETEEPQVLDLSSLLAQQGIQVIDQSDMQTIDGKDAANVFRAEDIIIEETGDNNITMVAASQSEAQSAHALLNLANVQAEEMSVQVSEILAAQRQAQEEEEDASAGKALLELGSEQNAATYIVDENGTMIPLTDVRPTPGEEVVSSSQSCALCPAQYSSHQELTQHHKDAHPGEMPWKCGVCSKRYHKKVAMKAHMRAHNEMARYQCSTCKKVFFYKRAMTRHIKQHTCEKPFKCTICGEMLNTLWELRKHRINHQTRSLFHCDICSKVFKQKATLVVHSRVHTGQKPYTCDICNKSFSLKSTLTQHRRIHTGEKPNICPICGQRFRQGSTMQAHIKRHTHVKPFICRYCRMRFAYQDELTEHELAHAHNKKWECSSCGMRFKNQSLLARHCRRHTNERPFVCEVCNKSFVQSGSLRAHMRSHTNEKPYYCRMCSKAYATSGTLLLHIRKVHNLNVKTVKEVFPVHKYIEDQKVFTIRNKPLVGNEMVVHSDGTAGNSESVTVVLEETNPTSEVQKNGDTHTDNESISIDNSLAKTIEGGVEQTSNVVVVASEGDFSVTASTHHIDDVIVDAEDVKEQTVAAQEVSSEQASETVLTNLEPLGDIWNPQEESNEPVQVAAEVNISSHSLHSAQDRQEAALGLAELSLFGTGPAGSNATGDVGSPTQKTKTFFKEEEEDENDPNVTKIILSKEGGVMNSQDPHQCPVCHRIFGRKSIMVEHLRIHTDEKPYECDFCHAGFRQNAQLRSHIRNRHTKIERFQCSFCHNRFLSRSITIRHIKFHHKLKVKFCQEADPAWTVDAAVWCDEKFEFNIEDPQYLKVSKKNKTTGKKPKKSSAQSEANLPRTLPDVLPFGQTYVVKVSDQAQVDPSEVTVETSAVESQEVVLDGEAQRPGKKVASTSARTVGTLTYATPEDTVTQGKETISADSDYLGSQLLCGTCKMQFSCVASLREHLLSVHNTTLAESDVSYVFEDENQATVDQEAEETERKGQAKQNVSNSQGEITLQNLKPVVLSMGEVQQTQSKDEAIDTSDIEFTIFCRICSQGFFFRDDLDQHMKSHTDEEVESVGMHRCDTCSLVMKNTQEVAKHIQRCHGVSRIYSCSICDKEFYQESSVYRHMKFFHKWEIKIRGENNIPVIVKPAPPVLHNPASSSGYHMPKTRRKMGRHGKFLTQGRTIGAQVDKIIEDVVESKVELSHPDTLRIEFEDQGNNLVEKSVSGSLTVASPTDGEGGDSEAPSFIIMRDGAVEGEENTQNIVQKLMALFRSKADLAEGDPKKLPKIIKVTTMGFSEDEINTIADTDLTEAFNQLEENNKSQASGPASDETRSQVTGSSDEAVSGKGFISTLQGKKRMVGIESSARARVSVKQKTKSDIPPATTEIQQKVSALMGQSDPTVKADVAAESSLAQMLKSNNPSKSSAKISDLFGEDDSKTTVKTERNVKGSKPVSRSKSNKAKTVSNAQPTAQDKTILEKLKAKTLKPIKDLEKAGTAPRVNLSPASKKSTISTLPTPPQIKNISVKEAKSVNVIKNTKSLESYSTKSESSDKTSRVTLEEKKSAVQGADVLDRRSKPVERLEVPVEKMGKSSPKKVVKGSVTHERAGVAQAERRSSSGRLIKAKRFGDEVEDMSPLRKRHK